LGEGQLGLRTIRDGILYNACAIGTDRIHAQRGLFANWHDDMPWTIGINLNGV